MRILRGFQHDIWTFLGAATNFRFRLEMVLKIKKGLFFSYKSSWKRQTQGTVDVFKGEGWMIHFGVNWGSAVSWQIGSGRCSPTCSIPHAQEFPLQNARTSLSDICTKHTALKPCANFGSNESSVSVPTEIPSLYWSCVLQKKIFRDISLNLFITFRKLRITSCK